MPENARLRWDNRGRMWADQFRRRWGGRHGSMKVRDLVIREELRGKTGVL